ncbi:MAG: hypothetical protein CR994_00410 [Maribacter sp.]|nr:MAG: hypothetical protein CR994_00410 [Maribacter sp.]
MNLKANINLNFQLKNIITHNGYTLSCFISIKLHIDIIFKEKQKITAHYVSWDNFNVFLYSIE